MDEFEQALNHVYTPPSHSRSPRAIPLMVAVHTALLTHVQDRSEKPSTGRASIGRLLSDLLEVWEADYINQDEPDEKVRAEANERIRLARTSGAEEDTQAHVWRAKLGGVKEQDINPDDMFSLADPHSKGEWRGVKLLEVDEHIGWEKVLLGCLIEVRET